MKTIEVWVCVDEDGDYTVGEDQSVALDRYTENINGDGGRRFIKLSLTVAPPARIQLSGTVPDTDGNVTLTVG